MAWANNLNTTDNLFRHFDYNVKSPKHPINVVILTDTMVWKMADIPEGAVPPSQGRRKVSGKDSKDIHKIYPRNHGLLRPEPWHKLMVGKEQYGCTYPGKKREEIVLLVVDDISRVPLVPLLGVSQPDSTGPGLPSTTASQPLTAPTGKTSPQD